jgi:hypothetical protein
MGCLYKKHIMKKGILLSLCSLILMFSFAQSGDPNKSPRNVTGFHGVAVSDGVDLYFTQGAESVSVSASTTEYRDEIKTVVKNGILMIYLENHHPSMKNAKLRAYVSAPTLDNLEASGGSDVSLEGMVRATKLDISLSGGSDLKGKLSASDLSIRQSGGSDVSLSGAVGSLTDEASGGSDLSGYDLVTDYCHIRASGGSDAHLTVNKELTASASGGCDIFYKGDCVVKQITSSGSSSIMKKG